MERKSAAPGLLARTESYDARSASSRPSARMERIWTGDTQSRSERVGRNGLLDGARQEGGNHTGGRCGWDRPRWPGALQCLSQGMSLTRCCSRRRRSPAPICGRAAGSKEDSAPSSALPAGNCFRSASSLSLSMPRDRRRRDGYARRVMPSVVTKTALHLFLNRGY